MAALFRGVAGSQTASTSYRRVGDTRVHDAHLNVCVTSPPNCESRISLTSLTNDALHGLKSPTDAHRSASECIRFLPTGTSHGKYQYHTRRICCTVEGTQRAPRDCAIVRVMRGCHAEQYSGHVFLIPSS
jgi:hypothetical protein